MQRFVSAGLALFSTSRFVLLLSVSGALAVLYGAAPCRAADWPQPIVPPKVEAPSTIKPITPSAPVLAPITSSKVESPGTIGPPPLSSLPNIVSGPNVAALQGADPHRAALPGLLEQMNTGRLLPEKAWADKLINVEDLLWIFSSYIGPWGNLGAQKNVEVRRALVKLLLENGGAKLQPIEKQPPTVRLWIADYYQGLGDEKCIALCEGILAEIKAPAKGENALIFQAIERMAWFYRASNQPRKGAGAWLRMNDYHADNGWWTPDALMESARLWHRAGEAKKALELYAQVPQYGNGWITGLSLVDQANTLFGRGEFEKGRALLQQPISGPEAEAIRVIMLYRLGYSYFLTGNLEKARDYSLQSIKAFDALTKNGHSVDTDIAQATLQWVEIWAKETILCEPKQLRVLLPAEPSKPVVKRISVLTHQKVPLQVQSDSPHVIARLMNDKAIQRSYVYEHEIQVEVTPQTNQLNWQASLLISSPGRGNFQKRLLVDVESPAIIQLSKPRCFFGFVKAGEAVQQTLRLSAKSDFVLTGVETDDAAVKAALLSEGKSATEHNVVLTLSPARAGQTFEGRLRVKTNVPQQKVIEVPYFALAQ